jgi:hypothetical protein
VLVIHYITTSRLSFNWVDILCSKLAQAISSTKHMAPRKYPNFHMSLYLLDIMCSVHAYLEMGWAWKSSDPPIHVYYKILWEHKFCCEYQRICDQFFIPLFQLLFCEPAPCMPNKSHTIIGRVGE